MIVDVKDIQVGDEILVGSNSNFRWFRVVRPPKIRTKGGALYSAVRCSTKVNITQIPVHTWPKGAPQKYRERKEYEVTGEGHNTEMYVNLNYKQAWLLTRNGQKV